MPQRTPIAVAALFVMLIAFASTLPGSQAGEPPRLFHVRDYGAVPDSETECGEAIRAAIQAAMAAETRAEVVLEAGTYRVQGARPRGYCFPIRQAENLTIRGAGKATRIVVTNPAAGARTHTPMPREGLPSNISPALYPLMTITIEIYRQR